MNKPGTVRILIALLLLFCLVEGAAAVTVVVAAQDSSALSKASAQYICDGTGDQELIKAAIASLPWDGGTVLLKEGTYCCTDNIVPGAYTTLKGEGVGRTIIDIQGYYMGIKVDRPYITLQDFTITGRGWVRITASHIQVRNVAAKDALHGYYPGKFDDMGANGAFFVWADNRVVEDIEFNQCSATDIGTHGFNLNGQGTPKMIRNIRFIDCTATLCGDANGHPWATGFDFHETNDLVDCQVVRCVADNNWESGFHFEPGDLQQNIVMTDCLSTNNGQRNTNDGDFTVQPPVPAHFYMAGYTIAMGTTLNNCRSINNRNYGFYDEQNGANVFNGCTDQGSGYGWKICKNVEDVQLNNCVSVDAQHWALWIAYARNIQVRGFQQYNTAGRTDISPQVQSILGYYKGESAYEKPVTGSYFDITAHGCALPILNVNGTYNGPGNGNTYSLKNSDAPYVAPTVTVTRTPTLPPEQAVDPVPLTTPAIQDPYPVPGKIEAENYLPGAEVGYHDTTSGNEGAVYRFDDVDVERLADGNGYDVGFIRAGEWLKYNISAQSAGIYNLDFRVASPFSDRSFTFQVDGVNAGGVTVPKTGSYDTYTTVRTQVYLGAGLHQLRLDFNNADNSNLDYINVIYASGGSPTQTIIQTPTSTIGPEPTMPAIPGHTLPTRIEARDYDLGGEGMAYHDTTPGNQGGAYRHDDVDISHSPSEGSDVITGIAPGEWIRYTVNIPSGGIYTASFRVAGIDGGTRFGVQLDGADISLITVPDTGSLDQFTTIKRMVWLPSGNHTLELTFNNPMAIRSIDIQSLTAPTPTPTPTTPGPTTVPTGTVPANTTTTVATPTVNTTPNQTPPSGAYIQHTFPTRIEAEDYDYGGQGVGYYDLTPEEETHLYRSDGVDIRYSQSRGSYYFIADVDGEWLAYTVTIPSSGIYTLAFDLAGNGLSACSLEVDNSSVCSVVGLDTGSLTTFQEVQRQAWLPAGTHTLKLNFAGPMAVNAIDAWLSSGPAPTFTTRPGMTPVVTTPAVTPTMNLTPTTTVPITQTTNATPTIPQTPVATPTTAIPTATTQPPTTTTPDPTVTATPPYQLGLPHQIPSRIEAEDFDLGGEGVAYHDTTAGNDGGQYRPTEGVDIEYNPTEKNYNIGWIFPGEWTSYTVNVTAAGTYTADFRVSTAWNGISLTLMLDDNPTPLTTVEVPNTGSYGTYTTVHKTVYLPAGQHRIKLFYNGYENINYMEFTPTDTPVTTQTTLLPSPSPPTTLPTATISTTVPTTVPTTIGTPGTGTTSPYLQHTLPTRVEAEDFDTGGEGYAYHDTTTLNEGGQSRSGDGVDIEYNPAEKSYNIGWIRDGEWLLYTVNVPTAGTYTTTFRVATPGLGRQIQVSVDGTPATTVGIPTSSSFDVYQDVVAQVSLPAGTHQVRLLLKGGSMNLNFMTFAAPAGPVTTQTTPLPVTSRPTTQAPTPVPTTVPATLPTTIRTTSPYLQHTLPARIEAEDFDKGGEGYAYHDSTPQNEGGQYRREEGVDIEYSQQEKSYDVGWIRDGEWLLYTVNVPTAGTYTTTFRAAVPTAGAHIRMQVDGNDLADPTLTRTGSFETFSDTVVQVSLPAGTHRIKLLPGGGSMNLNYFTISAAGQPTQTPTQVISTIPTMPPVTPTPTITQTATYRGTPFRPHVLPARIEAEDYDRGGEMVAYHDSTPQNEGGVYRSDGVDIEYNAGEKSFDVGWVRNGEWLTYTVTAGAARTYTGSFRVATPTIGKQIRVSVDNRDAGVVTIPATGSFNQFSTVTTRIPLTPGIHQIRLTFVGDELNFNYFELS